ncbi:MULTISPECIES: asparagine synthase (glutamine-hydrolyzing) [unclassified Dyella]|uniref:asparagine synthase (glutamine-hydrolyzing) n=1 Tax=unclassified Dyella TaxID=2634549 RepID=UPI001E2CE21A|nr:MULTISPECIES: asparagine synthase (glutamine-hydrolyzing) [unclassified Dyella]MDR3444773.1 asparagine synthase (glutamine-hydrolyzing) [Dyella sp.]
MDEALQRLRQRGPDESGCFVGDDFIAGHTRLAIIDVKGGHQPMRDPSGRWVLVFNGEIYNYRELRAQLAERWNFRDDSDTEVLLAGLVTEGARFVERLDGMWAFVLHDSASGDVLLSRDRFGKKPLYYRRHGATFACASELPALAVLTPDVAVREDAAGIADYFRYGYALPGKTCVAGVSEILPAHTLRLRADGSSVHERYWAPSVEPWTGSFGEAAEQIRELLTQGVRRRQLASDVEVGAFLSGGVDSTTVCALAQASGFGRLRTFTAGFAEPTFDERAPAARAAAELGTLHTAEEIKPDMAAILATELPRRMGQPFGDSSLVPSALVASVAARHVKVVLTGDGSDEIFGGYARYMGRLLRQRYHMLPASLRSMIERGVLATPEPYAHHSGSLLKRAHLFVRLAREDRDAYIGPPAIRKETLAQLVPGLGAGNSMSDRPWPDDPNELRHMLLQDCLVYLPQDILQKVDRATMMYSLEARSPFLDKALFEFVIRLPWQWHFSGMRGKRLLHAAMRGRVPDFIWKRRKQGFASPVSHWLRNWLGDELLAMTDSEDTGVVDAAGLHALLREHRAGRADHSQPLWLAYAYLRWRAG